MTGPAPTVLVTGSNGFLAPHVIRAIARDLPAATVLRFGDRLDRIGPFLSAGPRPCMVVHLAARTARGGPAEPGETERLVAANIVGVQELLRELHHREIGRLLFASTLDVYDAAAPTINESSPVAPRTPYAASKWLGETLAQDWARTQRANLTIVRIGNLYGPGEAAYRKLIPVTIERALRGQSPIVVGRGRALRDFVYVEDAASMVVSLARRLMTNGGDDVVNLASGVATSVADVVRIIGEEVGFSSEAVDTDPESVSASPVFDVKKLESCVSARPYTPMRDGIRREVAWFRRRLNAAR